MPGQKIKITYYLWSPKVGMHL